MKFRESKIRDRHGTQFLNGHFSPISSCNGKLELVVELIGDVVALLELTCDPDAAVLVAFFLQNGRRLKLKSILVPTPHKNSTFLCKIFCFHHVLLFLCIN